MKEIKKLVLNKETITNLNDSQMNQIRGEGVTSIISALICNSLDCIVCYPGPKPTPKPSPTPGPETGGCSHTTEWTCQP